MRCSPRTILPQPARTALPTPWSHTFTGATAARYAGRVYVPNALVNSSNNGISLIFDGYNTGYAAKKSNNAAQQTKDLSSYRNVGQVSLSSGAVVIH